MPKRIDIPKDMLRHLYDDAGLTQKEIADRVGCDAKTISNRMRKYGMETRTPGDYVRLDLPCHKLRQLYCEKMLSLPSIAEHFGCSVGAIQAALN